MEEKKRKWYRCGTWIGIAVLYFAAFGLHRGTPFMMDDIWYGTNLATGEPLSSLWDVFEGQAWHFMNWGGRSITHGILQLTILSGEWMADILNIIMTALLARMVCILADAKKPEWFLLASVMIFGSNANMRMSMFWQAGVVNYVYSTVWILAFFGMYLSVLMNPGRERPPGAFLWMPILGLMTGWSNENMGPAAMVVALGITVYLWKKQQMKPQVWMVEGILFAFAGSLLVILAPGNFCRAATITYRGFGDMLYQRFLSMVTATAEYLFPILAFTVLVWLVYHFFCGEHLDRGQIALLVNAVLAHGAMVLSPHYPDRATFGILVLCVILSISMLVRIYRNHPKTGLWMLASGLAFGIRSIYLMLEIYA